MKRHGRHKIRPADWHQRHSLFNSANFLKLHTKSSGIECQQSLCVIRHKIEALWMASMVLSPRRPAVYTMNGYKLEGNTINNVYRDVGRSSSYCHLITCHVIPLRLYTSNCVLWVLHVIIGEQATHALYLHLYVHTTCLGLPSTCFNLQFTCM